MNKDLFKGIIGLVALAIYFLKFGIGLVLYANGEYQSAAYILLIGIAVEFLAFLYVMKK